MDMLRYIGHWRECQNTTRSIHQGGGMKSKCEQLTATDEENDQCNETNIVDISGITPEPPLSFPMPNQPMRLENNSLSIKLKGKRLLYKTYSCMLRWTTQLSQGRYSWRDTMSLNYNKREEDQVKGTLGDWGQSWLLWTQENTRLHRSRVKYRIQAAVYLYQKMRKHRRSWNK